MKNMSKLYMGLLLGLGVSHAAFAAAAYAAAELKMDRSVISDAYWEIWNDAEQARIDADIEANRKADGTFDIAAPDGGGVKGEPLVSGLFTRDMQKKPFLPESYLWRHPDFRLIYTTDKIQFGYFSRRERESSASYFR